MSMYPHEVGAIPPETASVARAACPKGTLAMRWRDALGTVFTDEDFVALYAVKGQPGYAPWRLALVTVLQYVDGLTDRQAADAVRERIDWKYALGLDLTDAGFDYSLLSAFRSRLLEGQAETLLLETCRQRGWRKRGREDAHGLDACAGQCARPQSPRTGGRDAASRAGGSGRIGTRLAAAAQPARVV